VSGRIQNPFRDEHRYHLEVIVDRSGPIWKGTEAADIDEFLAAFSGWRVSGGGHGSQQLRKLPRFDVRASG
jgi:hypothetical protein